MSILETLFGALFGDDDDSAQETVVEHPCSNCPGSCSIAPDACSVCQPYKEQMIDAIYWVEHKDELVSRYEVTGNVSQGAVTCPHCGGHSEDPYVCEYCGSRLQEGTAKIKVASAADIPNPVLEAQNIIFARYEAVKDFAGADEAYGLVDALSGVGSEGLLSSIFDALMGNSADNDSKTIGNKMTESEIKEMASYYNVSVAEYLTGLDNGKYLTMSNKKTAAAAEEQYSQNTSSSSGGSLLGFPGMAGAIGLGSLLFGGSAYNYSAARPKQPRPRPQSYQTVSSPRPPQSTGLGYQPSSVRPAQNTGTGFQTPPVRPAQSAQSGQTSKPQGIIGLQPAKKPSMPVSPAQKPSAQTIRPARKPSDSHTASGTTNARRPASNSSSQQKRREDAIHKAMNTVSSNQSQAKKKTAQKGSQTKPKRP